MYVLSIAILDQSLGKVLCSICDTFEGKILSVSADIISCVEFNSTGELLATGDKGGRVVIFQRDRVVRLVLFGSFVMIENTPHWPSG